MESSIRSLSSTLFLKRYMELSIVSTEVDDIDLCSIILMDPKNS